MKNLRVCIQKATSKKTPNPNYELHPAPHAANPGNSSNHQELFGIVSTDQPGDANVFGETPIDAIAIVEVLGKGSSVQLDTSARHFLLLNVATAMRHASTLPQARYVAALDEWGRVLL